MTENEFFIFLWVRYRCIKYQKSIGIKRLELHVIICPLLHLWWITRHTRGFLLSYARKRSQGVNQLIWVAIQSIVEDFSDSIFKMTELLVLWCTGFLIITFTWRTFVSPCTLNNNRQNEYYVLAKLLGISPFSQCPKTPTHNLFLHVAPRVEKQSFLPCCTKSGKASLICGICYGLLMWNWFLFYANSATPKMKIGKNVNNIEL